MYRYIFNHFYIIGPKVYWISWNNAKYTAITLLKVIQGHRFWYQSEAHERFLLVIDTNLPAILHRFQVMADYCYGSIVASVST